MNPEELLIALKNADAAGDTAAAQKLASLYAQAVQAGPQEKSMDMESGSIADPLGQGLSFGFSDELAGGLGAGVNSVANLFGAGTGESFGQAYEGIRDSARYNNEAFQTRNPKTGLAAELVGGILTGGAGAARVGALKGAQSLGRLGAVGAGQGGAYGLGASEADDIGGLLTDTAKGAALGGAGGLLLPAAGRAVANRFKSAGEAASQSGGRVAGLLDDVGDEATDVLGASARQGANTSGRYADDVALLRDNGVVLTTGQRTGAQGVRTFETTIDKTVYGGAIAKAFEKQRQQFQRKLLEMAGAPATVRETGLITDDVLEATGNALSKRYQAALKGKTVTLGDDFIDDLAAVEARHSRLVTSQQRREIRSLVDDFLTDATKGGVSGNRYQKLRSLMGKRARQNQLNNKPLADLFGDMQSALDDAFTRSVGGSNKALNTQYAQFKQLQNAWRRGGGAQVAQGYLPMASLNSAAKKLPGSQQWRKFINAGSAVMGDAVANSGTASRAANLLATGTGGVPAWMANQALARGVGGGAPQAVGGLLSGAGRGVQAAGNLAGATAGPVGVAAIPGLLSDPPLPPL